MRFFYEKKITFSEKKISQKSAHFDYCDFMNIFQFLFDFSLQNFGLIFSFLNLLKVVELNSKFFKKCFLNSKIGRTFH